MKKIVFEKTGKPNEVLKVTESEKPTYGPDEVLLKVSLAAINPSDMMFIQNLYGIRPQLPSAAGFEGVGVIVEAGENAKLPIGTRVGFAGIGAWGEYTVAHRKTLIPVPDVMPDEVAAQLFVNPFTAVAMIEDAGVKAGDWLMITACASALGKMAIQMCKLKGIKTIGTVRRDDLNDELRALGIDEIINTETENMAARVKQITAGNGVHAVLECVGGATAAEAMKCLARGGTMIVYGLLSLENPPLDMGLMIFKEIIIKGFWRTEWVRRVDYDTIKRVTLEVISLMSSGQVSAPVEAVYGLNEITQAVTHADTPGRWGKVLVRP